MKIFNRDLNEFKEPVLKEEPQPDILNISIDIPAYDSDWMYIKNSKNKMMCDYASKDGEPLEISNLTEVIQIIEKVNEETEKKYRLPYLKEIFDTLEFYGLGPESMRKKFAGSIMEGEEWLGETIKYFKTRGYYQLYRYPSEIELIDGNLIEIDNSDMVMALPTEKGYYTRRDENKFGYPVAVFDQRGMSTFYFDIYKKAAESSAPAPVFRGYDAKQTVHNIHTLGRSFTRYRTPAYRWKFRLVEVNE